MIEFLEEKGEVEETREDIHHRMQHQECVEMDLLYGSIILKHWKVIIQNATYLCC